MVTVSRRELAYALKKLNVVVDRQAEAPVLTQVRAKARDGVLELVGTDMEVWLSGNLEVLKGKRDRLDSCLPAYQLGRAVTAGTGDTVGLEVDDAGRLHAKIGDATLVLPGCQFSYDFPEPLCSTTTVGFPIARLRADALAAILDKVACAMSTDETRESLNSVCWTGQQATATDGHRLHVVDLEGMAGEDGQQFRTVRPVALFPRRAVWVLGKLLTGDYRTPALVSLRRKKGEVGAAAVHWGEWTLETRLLDGEYPDYTQAFPRGGGLVAQASRSELLDRLKRAQRMIPKVGQNVQLVVDPGADTPVLGVTCRAKDNAGETLELKFELTTAVQTDNRSCDPHPEKPETYPGERAAFREHPVRTAVQSKYLLDALQALTEETVTLEMRADALPATVSEEGLTIVIMSMRG